MKHIFLGILFGAALASCGDGRPKDLEECRDRAEEAYWRCKRGIVTETPGRCMLRLEHEQKECAVMFPSEDDPRCR